MPVPGLNALFALGVYLGSPNGSDPNAEQMFERGYAGFVSTMGVAPAYVSTAIDNSQPIGAWVGEAGWQAWSSAQSPVARALVPVIALQMSSTAPGAGKPQAQFRDVAAGLHDDVVERIVDVWAQNGFKRLVIRLGPGMNVDGPAYAGDTPQSQADWVRAFRHVAHVLKSEARARGVSLQVMWNPDTTNGGRAHATTSLYPGDDTVDIVGADIYADVSPYPDTLDPTTYHDWATGGEDTTLAQFLTYPATREHYWSLPAADIHCADCSDGYSQSLDSLIAFALQHRKPFAIAESGAGNTDHGADIADEAAFPLWLAQELTAAQAAGLRIAFVTIWDDNDGGTYHFSDPSDAKPLEAASWAKYFGLQPHYGGYGASPIVSLGGGQDRVVLWLAEDAWQGDAQFTVSVDGQAMGGTMTVIASRAAGQHQVLELRGDWGAGQHSVAVTYLNDANDGTAATDRNLYVTNLTYDGIAPARHQLYLLAAGTQSATVGTAP
jgi:hypothetical protein